MPVERRGQAIRVMITLVNWQQEEPNGCGGGRQLSMDGTSRVTGDCHARFCERLGVKFPRADSAAISDGRPYRDRSLSDSRCACRIPINLRSAIRRNTAMRCNAQAALTGTRAVTLAGSPHSTVSDEQGQVHLTGSRLCRSGPVTGCLPPPIGPRQMLCLPPCPLR